MPNYQNSKIYKLVSPHTDEIYIGSTTQKLCQRLSGHSRSFRKKNKCTSVKLLELGKVKIVLIEDFPCDRKEELLKRERYYIENFDCVNKYIPGRTKKEYYEDNKELISEKAKVYREENKEIITQKVKVYREKNKEIISQQRKGFYENNKEKMREKAKEYRGKNKEIISQREKEYRGKNKEIISQRKKVKYTCDCGSIISRAEKARHEKTIKHQNYLLQNK